jgi:DNA repair protein RAD16
MRLLRRQVLPALLLRRTKASEAGVLALPPRAVVVRRDAFSPAEADYYEALYTQSQAQFSTCVYYRVVFNRVFSFFYFFHCCVFSLCISVVYPCLLIDHTASL